MKLLVPFLSAVVLCLLSAGAHATGAPHYALIISGVSKTELSGSTSVKTVPFNNTTILKAIIATGTSGVTKTSDLDIVMDSDMEIDAINRTTHELVTVLGQAGSLSDNGVIQTESKTTIARVTSANAFSFTFPDGFNTYNVNILFSTFAYVSTGEYYRLVMSFNGGDYPANPSTFIIGSVRSTGRIYHYGG